MNVTSFVTEKMKLLSDICNNNLLFDGDLEIFDEVKLLEKDRNSMVLKISIIGEFSSGKSSLLNGILGGNFLSVSDEPTTATNTYISYGTERKAIIFFSDGTQQEETVDNLDIYLKESSKAKTVSYVNIECPVDFLKKGVKLIDTPGANADILSHNTTRQVAIDESNATVVVISAQSGIKKTLIDFLKVNKAKLYKFIFVINKCDTLEMQDDIDSYADADDSKLDLLRNDIRKKIENEVGIKISCIHCISAQMYLSNKESSVINVRGSFDNLVKEIEKISTNEKDKEYLLHIGLVEKLQKIQSCLQERIMNEHLNTRNSAERLNKKNLSIDNIESKLISQVKKSTIDDIINLKNEINDSISKSKIHLKKEIHEYIESVTDESKFEKKVPKLISSFITEATSNFSGEVIESLLEILKKQIIFINEQFFLEQSNLLREYHALGLPSAIKKKFFLKSFLYSAIVICPFFLLNTSISIVVFFVMFPILFLLMHYRHKKMLNCKIENNAVKIEKINIDFKSNIVVEEINKSIIIRFWIGVLVAIIGTVILPVIGTIIGFYLGIWIGKLFAPSLSDIKALYHRETLRVLSINLDQYHKALLDTADMFFELIEKESFKKMKRLRKRYNYVFNYIKRYNSKQVVRLDEQSKELLRYDSEVKKAIIECGQMVEYIKDELENGD